MPVETPDDIAAFFSDEEFGVSIRIDGQGPFVAIHEKGSGKAEWGGGEVVQGTDRFLFPDLPSVAIVEGGEIEIVASGRRFEIFGEPTHAEGIWTVTGSPLA